MLYVFTLFPRLQLTTYLYMRLADFFDQVAGIEFMLPKAVFHGLVPVLNPPGPLTAEVADAMHQVKMVEISVIVPSILQDLASSESSLENLCQMSAVIYGGGPLPSEIGNVIAARTRLYNFMGGSEMTNIPTVIVDREDWEYFKFSSKLGCQMRHYSDDLFELVFIRQPHLERYQAIFSTLPNHQEYSTNDLYIKHPTKPSLWKYSGRADDIIVLTTGEKINPVNMESWIGAHPGVRSVLVVGHARFQTALLVQAREPSLCGKPEKNFIDDLWPTVQKANAQCDTHARISRELILFTKLDKPFLRAGKGTVQRRMTVDSYEGEIDELYCNFENCVKPHASENGPRGTHQYNEGSLGKPLYNLESIQDWFQNLICTITGWTHLDIDTDFFALGMDSLQVLSIVRAMNAEKFHAYRPRMEFTAKMIYTNPTIRLLEKAWATTRQLPDCQFQDLEANTKTTVSEIEKLISKYSWNMPTACRPPLCHSSSDMHVLLTGSTGSLGSYILENLLGNPKVAHIYCLNRSPDSEKRQRDMNETRGLCNVWPADRITFFQGDLSQEYLGLNFQQYRLLLAKVTHILHNAWEVNFNLPLTSFETPHVLGIRQYIDFSIRSAKGASIFFVSSVSSCAKWSLKHDRPVPESLIDDSSMPFPIGYAQSKYVAEQVLSRAAEIAGIAVRICRVGQVAGPVGTNGQGACWNKQEWLPSLIASSKHLGKIPESLGLNESIDWIPVDILSRVLVELMECPSTRATKLERNPSPEDSTCSMTNNDCHETTSIHTFINPTTALNIDHKLAPNSVFTAINDPLTIAKGRRDVSSLGHGQSSHSYKGSKLLTNGDSLISTVRVTAVGGDNDEMSRLASDTTSNRNDERECNQYYTSIRQESAARVYHAVNPHRTTWSTLLSVVKEHFGSTLQIVSLNEWVDTLSQSAISTENVNVNPAIKLLDFFQSLLSKSPPTSSIFETAETELNSRELAALEAIKPEWMRIWLEQWNF